MRVERAGRSRRLWNGIWRAGWNGIIAVIAILTLFNHHAWSQSSRTVKIVIPFPAGGASDILTRTLTEEIGRIHGISTVIENRPGSGTIVATEAVARAAPDGNTLLVNANSFVINPSLKKLSYDPLTSFAPICYLAGTPMFVVVESRSPYHTLAELVAAARSRPGELTIASLGPATAQHIAIELLKRTAAINMTFVPYPGNVPAITALLGGHVTSALGNYPEVIEQLRAGKLRALATTSPARVSLLPDVPTVAESGFPGYGAEVWIGLVAPAQTPQSRLAEMAAWITEAAQIPAVAAKLTAHGLFPKKLCGEEFAAFMRAQLDGYARAIRDSSIKTE